MTTNAMISHRLSIVCRSPHLQRLSAWVAFFAVQSVWGREACLLELGNGEVSERGVLFGDGGDGKPGTEAEDTEPEGLHRRHPH